MKIFIWCTPFIGIIYLFICLFKPSLWIETSYKENAIKTMMGLIVQVLSWILLIMFVTMKLAGYN